MALFGLGSFAEGFVGGLAESANKALLEDMEAIKNRVKTVSDYRVKRAIEEQEERKDELTEIEDALKEGASLFDDNDPRAADYAATLLKQQGSIPAYKELVAQLRESKNKSGTDLGQFFYRASVDAPETQGYTISDYAKAYQGAAKTLPDYRLPEDAATAGAGRLLSGIGLGQDVTGQIQTRTQEQMAAMGVGKEDDFDYSIKPGFTFASEDFTLSDKTASEKITYYNEKLVDPNISDDKKAEYKNKLQTQIGIAAASEDENIRLSGLEQQLASAPDEQRPAIIAEIKAIKKTISRKEAELNVEDPLATTKLDRNDAWARSQDETLSPEERDAALKTFYDLGEQIEDFSKGEPTFATETADMLEDFQMRQTQDPTFKAGNPEYDTMYAELTQRQNILDNTPGSSPTLSSINSAKSLLTSAIEEDLIKVVPSETYAQFVKIKRRVDAAANKREALDLLNETELKIYNDGMATSRGAAQNAVNRVIGSLSGPQKRAAISAAVVLGYDAGTTVTPSAESADTEAKPAGTDTTTDTTAATTDDTGLSAEEKAKQVVPDTPESAAAFLNKLMARGMDINAEIAAAKERNYSPEFIAVLEAEKDTDTTMTRAAMDPGIDYEQAEKEDVAARTGDVEAALEVINDRWYDADSREIRDIAKKLGISKEQATELHARAMDEKAKRDAANKPKGRNRRGMMARSTEKAQGE